MWTGLVDADHGVQVRVDRILAHRGLTAAAHVGETIRIIDPAGDAPGAPCGSEFRPRVRSARRFILYLRASPGADLHLVTADGVTRGWMEERGSEVFAFHRMSGLELPVIEARLGAGD